MPRQGRGRIGHGEPGFTLIEMLVSLALLGLAATLLLEGLATAGIVAQRQRGRTAEFDELVSAQRVLRSGIERLRPVVRSDSGIPILELRGTRNVLTYIAPPLDRSAPDALTRFRLTRTASGDLVLYTASTRDFRVEGDGRDLTGWTPNPLLHGVRDLTIDYLGAPRPGLARGWQERWWDRSSPPELIRIRIGFAQGDRRRWPDLVIRPRVTRYGVCRLDAFTGRCGDEQ